MRGKDQKVPNPNGFNTCRTALDCHSHHRQIMAAIINALFSLQAQADGEIKRQTTDIANLRFAWPKAESLLPF